MSQLEQIMSVMDAAFDPHWGERWTRRQVSDALILPNTVAITIDDSGNEISSCGAERCAGFVLARFAADEEELLLIAVRPDMRKKGLGRSLINLLKKQAREDGIGRIFLEMRSNNPAEHLYRQMGFEPIGRRNNYYKTSSGNRLDAITFALDIK